MSNEPKFPELPVEVQVALINAAAAMATIKITAIAGNYSKQFSFYEREYNFFDREYKKICDSLYKENKGR